MHQKTQADSKSFLCTNLSTDKDKPYDFFQPEPIHEYFNSQVFEIESPSPELLYFDDQRISQLPSFTDRKSELEIESYSEAKSLSIPSKFIFWQKRQKQRVKLHNFPRTMIRMMATRQKYFKDELSKENAYIFKQKLKKFLKQHEIRLSTAKDFINLLKEPQNKSFQKQMGRALAKMLRQDCLSGVAFAKISQQSKYQYLRRMKVYALRCRNGSLLERIRI